MTSTKHIVKSLIDPLVLYFTMRLMTRPTKRILILMIDDASAANYNTFEGGFTNYLGKVENCFRGFAMLHDSTFNGNQRRIESQESRGLRIVLGPAYRTAYRAFVRQFTAYRACVSGCVSIRSVSAYCVSAWLRPGIHQTDFQDPQAGCMHVA